MTLLGRHCAKSVGIRSTDQTAMSRAAGRGVRGGGVRKTILFAATLTALGALAGCGGSGNASQGTKSTTVATSTTSTSSDAGQAVIAEAKGATAETVTGTSGDTTATLHATTHQPKVGAPWPIAFTVTHAGQPAAASVSYEYLFGGAVVAHRSHYNFTGHFADLFRWPSSAVGYQLTFRAVIVSGGVTIDLDYPVQVAT